MKNNPMGKFNFQWEFLPLFLIISPTRCKQVKSNAGVFYYAEPDLQHGGNEFCFVGLHTFLLHFLQPLHESKGHLTEGYNIMFSPSFL